MDTETNAANSQPHSSGLCVSLSTLMDAIDSESDYSDYGYFLDPTTGKTHLLWDMCVDEVDDTKLFEQFSARIDEFIKLPDRSMTDCYARAEQFSDEVDIDETMRKRLKKACKKSRRTGNITLFLKEAHALGLYREQVAFWDQLDEAFVRQWCAEQGISIIE